jgi:hypothetical protein
MPFSSVTSVKVACAPPASSNARPIAQRLRMFVPLID